MKYKPDWERAKARMVKWWRAEPDARVALQVIAPMDGPKKAPPTPPDDAAARFCDIDYIMSRRFYELEHTYFAAEAFPCVWPNLGPDFMSAALGAELVFGETTSWAVPCLDTLVDCELHFDEKNCYFRQMEEMSKVIAANAPGNYMYAVTDLHPSLDTLCALCGAGQLMFDLIDEPEAVLRALGQVTAAFDELFNRFFEIGKEYQPDGSTTTLEVYSPTRYFAHVCDVIYMISNDMFRKYALPIIKHELEFFDDTIFHVDGVGSLNHLDDILALEKLKAVQWVYGDGRPGARHWTHVYKRIQDAGKRIYTYGAPEDLKPLLDVLDPASLMYCTRLDSREEADDYVRWAERLSFKKKLY